MKIDRIFKKLLKLPRLIKCYLSTNKSSLLLLIEEEAKDLLKQYGSIGTCNTEGIEDLLFHIRTYNEIPEIVKQTEFSTLGNLEVVYRNGSLKVFKNGNTVPTSKEIELYVKYLEEIEKQRAVERDFIFEKVKELPLGFMAC